MVVRQLLSGAGPVDAVTGQARAYRALFSSWGWGGSDHAVSIDPRMDGSVRPLRELDAGPGDVLLFHYSAYAPKLRPLLELPNRKLLVSHNVTPAKWFWRYEPVVAIHCAVGRAQLPEFARAVDVAAGVSAFNVAELHAAGAERTAVVPILFRRPPAGAAGAGAAASPSAPRILFVGRLTPHKRQDEVMRVFALYRRAHAPDAKLILVGEPLSPSYGIALRDLGERLAPGAVELRAGLSAEELWAEYRAASAFLCLSEHEGFCVPLLEAFSFGVPVVARATGGIPEVAGDAALLVGPEHDREVVAELLHLAVSDPDLRAQLATRATARLDHYAFDETARTLRATVESVVG